jgi:RNA polymerase sigma factor (sigma-70 family)
MSHLSADEVLAYLDGDRSIADLKKVARHLDKCDKCTSRLKDFGFISILFELTIAQANEQRERYIFGKCPDADTILYLIESHLARDDKKKVEAHLKECKFCREALEIIRATEEISEAKLPEIRGPEGILPNIIRNLELYFIAREREKVPRKEKESRIPILEAIHRMLWPKLPVLAPLGFAALSKRDPEFYRELDDGQLMEACKGFDNMAWFELERRFRNYAYSIIKAFGLEEDREDIWQVALRALAISIMKYEERGKVRYFIRKIVYYKCLIWKKRRLKEDKIHRSAQNLIQQNTRTSDLLDQLIEKKKAEHLIENIKKLPEKFSSVLMALIDGLSDKEIAHRLNIRAETVRTRKHRARAKLFEMKRNDPEFMS